MAKEGVEQWQIFYKELFGIEVDFSEVTVPENSGDFNQVIFMPKGMTYDMVEKTCKKAFKFWKRDNKRLSRLIDMDKEVRMTAQSYAIRVRDDVEADEVHKNKSAEMIAKEGVNSMTLLERLIYETFFYWTSGKNMDYKRVTLCAGSRYRGGDVPYAGFGPGDASVGVYRSGLDGRGDDLRVREVVS